MWTKIRTIWFEMERREAEGIHRGEGRDCSAPRAAGANKSKEVTEWVNENNDFVKQAIQEICTDMSSRWSQGGRA